MKQKFISSFFAFSLLALPITQSHAGIATYNRWEVPEINVCFADEDTEYYSKNMKGVKRGWKQKEKEIVKNVLEEEFTPSRTGYSFIGFKDCRETDEVDVVIGVRNGLSLRVISGELGRATVGRGSFNITNIKNARGAVLLAPTGITKNTITHEFGHVVGLKHEHLHPDAQTDTNSFCPYYLGNQKEFYEGLIYTKFDKISIMNYCHLLSPNGWNAGLSQKDQEVILGIFNKQYPFQAGHAYRP